MSTLSDVTVKIDLKKPIGRKTFGCPMILEIKAYGEGATAPEFKECRNLEEVITAGYAEDTNVYKAAALIFQQSHSPEKIAVWNRPDVTTALTDIGTKAWRQLIVVSGDETAIAVSDMASIATHVDTYKDRLFFATVATKNELVQLGSHKRTIGFVHTNPLASAALAGEISGYDAGSVNYKNTPLSGLESMDDVFTDTEITEIVEANGITFVTKAGMAVTTSGKTLSGDYADIIDGLDYVVTQLEYETQKLLINSPKIPYDNTGIAMLESVAVTVLQDAYNKGIIGQREDGTPDFTVSYANRQNVDPQNIVERNYLGGTFSFTVGGAIDTVRVTGTIEY